MDDSHTEPGTRRAAWLGTGFAMGLLLLAGCGSNAESDPRPENPSQLTSGRDAGTGTSAVAPNADGSAGQAAIAPSSAADAGNASPEPTETGARPAVSDAGSSGSTLDPLVADATDRSASSDPLDADDLPPMEQLVAELESVPAELAVVIDPALLLDTDPKDFPASATVGGEPVEIHREYHPANGNLLRIALVRPRRAEDGDAPPILHGPEWRYYDTAALRLAQWYKDGVAHGPARQWRRVSTRVFEGRFHEGERTGLRREYAKNGTMISARTYIHGVQVGLQEDWFPSGQKEALSNWRGGELHGTRKLWGRDGLLVLNETYVDGLLQGRWSDFHPKSGQPREWGTYEDGKRVGIWQRGSEAGTVIASIGYQDGVPHGKAQIWNESGGLVEEFVSVEGKKTGLAKTWYADGTPQSEGRLENGLRVGRWMYWKNDGSVNERWAGNYEDDIRTSALDGE